MSARALCLVLAFAWTVPACSAGLEEAADVLESPSASASASADTSMSGSTGAQTTGGPELGGRKIVVTAPERGVEVLSPVVVAGRAESTSGEVLVQVMDAQGMELAAIEAAVSCGSACRGEFRVELAFFVQSRQRGTVQVLEVGANGTAEHLVEVPVTLVPGV